jgi:CDGSH-type Zn-finger protein
VTATVSFPVATLDGKFGKLRALRPDAVPEFATSPISWLCDCGKVLEKGYFWVLRGSYTSCGRCNVMDAEYWTSTKFGKLRMSVPSSMNKHSSKKVSWICDCGKSKSARVQGVTSGETTSCGKCDWKESDYWTFAKFGKLRMETPAFIHERSAKRVSWLCECGNKTMVSVTRVTGGITSSCGKCSWKSADFWSAAKFGKLRMETPELVAPHSDKIVPWLCDCGMRISSTIHNVFSGATKTCGKCDVRPASYWASAVFGKLRMKSPVNLHFMSSKKVLWSCYCGGEKLISVAVVTSGKSGSCSGCYDKAYDWFTENRKKLSLLKTPIDPSSVPCGWIRLEETVRRVKSPIRALCGSCGSTYFPKWYDVKTGKSITCGCTTFRVSRPNREIYDFLSQLGARVVTEHKVGGLVYDLFLPVWNLLIEFNGLRWHSGERSRPVDFRKYENAVRSGHDFISLFEDEWAFRREQFESLLKNRLSLVRPQPVRPSSGSVIRISSFDADIFYSKHHYLGPCRPKISFGFSFRGAIIACISFSRPTRQSKHDWELVRMSSNPDFRVHGIWSKLLKMFVSEHSPSSIVSFSDNRLFSGSTYEKIGFRLDGDVKPDYYWVKRNRRFHKSGLRKTDEEKLSGKTESSLRKEQGYSKIWDLGKKRWVMEFHK